jgi:hypothetical protein
MNKLFAASGLALLVAAGSPVLAQDINGGTLTCAEYNALDAAGKNLAMGAVRLFAQESVNAAEAGTVAQMTSETDEVFMGRMDQACVAADGTSTVIAAMRQ